MLTYGAPLTQAFADAIRANGFAAETASAATHTRQLPGLEAGV